MRRPTHVAFTGTAPDVRPGDPVDVRDAFGDWHSTVARSEARYDDTHNFRGRCYLTVAVDTPDGTVVNWPAEDVRAATKENG